MTVFEIREAWRQVKDGLFSSIKCSDLIEESFNKGYVSHYEVGEVINIPPDKLAIDVINTGWNGRTTPDKGIAITTEKLHELLLHYVPVYKYAHQLGKEGILIYRTPKVNEYFGYSKVPSIDLNTLVEN